MSRRLGTLAALVVAAALLPGCAISLFSDTSGSDSDLERIEQLEQRVKRIEEALPSSR